MGDGESIICGGPVGWRVLPQPSTILGRRIGAGKTALDRQATVVVAFAGTTKGVNLVNVMV